MSFASDAIAGSDLTEVVIADLRVQQLAGFPDHFQFFMRVREYTEPPANPAAGAQAVQKEIEAEADAWAKTAALASNVLQDPASLLDAATKDPSLLAALDSGELGSFMSGLKDKLTGGDFGAILSALGKVDPQKVIALVGELKNAGSLSEFIQKLADEGIDLLEQVTGVDLGVARTLIEGIAGAGDFLDKLKKVKDKAEAVGEEIGALDPADLVKKGGSAPSASGASVVAHATELVQATNELLQTDTARAIVKLIPELGIGDQVKAGLKVIGDAATSAAEGLRPMKDILAQIDAASVLYEVARAAVENAVTATGSELEALGLSGATAMTSTLSAILAPLDAAYDFADHILAALPTDMQIDELAKSIAAISTTLSDFEKTLS